jgi:hypothetical protein
VNEIGNTHVPSVFRRIGVLGPLTDTATISGAFTVADRVTGADTAMLFASTVSASSAFESAPKIR